MNNKKNTLFGIALSALALAFLLQTTLQKQPTTQQTTACSQREQITNQSDSMYQSSVLVNDKEVESMYGTGYVVGKNYVATNRHVVAEEADHPEKAVVRVGHKDANGQVTFTDFNIKKITLPEDETIDLALLETEPLTDRTTISDLCSIAEFANPDSLKAGDTVTAVGFPGDKEYATLWASTGTVLEMMGDMFSFSGVTAPGNSGSPIFNAEGKVIAMNNAGDETTSFGFLMREELVNFLKNNME